MIFKFSLVSDEVVNFRREIQIDGDDTFFDLHNIIIECCGYDQVGITSFIMCDDWWKRKQEITLVEMDTDSDVDSLVMEEETLSDWLDEEKQKMIFIFDYNKDRGFYMELSEMILGENLSKPKCTKSQGTAPTQFLKEEEDLEPVIPVDIIPPPLFEEDEDVDEENEIDEIFYGEDDYNPEELDIEGFEELDKNDIDLDTPQDTDIL